MLRIVEALWHGWKTRGLFKAELGWVLGFFLVLSYLNEHCYRYCPHQVNIQKCANSDVESFTKLTVVKHCRVQLLVVIFCKLKQNRKSDDDDDAVHKLCSQRYKVQTVKLKLYKYKSWWRVEWCHGRGGGQLPPLPKFSAVRKFSSKNAKKLALK